ncbi:MAG: MG2 domain-containing protein [Desulfovibrionaceae bacterium]|nr:MG2 domain-containing protein [Desulfovibrionaceae bacterium]
MKKNLLFTALGVILALLAVALFSGGNDIFGPSSARQKQAEESNGASGVLPVSITSVALMDSDILARKKPMLITFSAPMIKSDAVNLPVSPENMPFSILPAMEGEGRWLTDRSIAFMASEAYRPGKKYVVRFRDDLTSLDGRPVRYLFSFRTEAPKVIRALPGQFNAESATLLLDLDFSRPLQPKALESHLKITDAESGEALPFTLRSQEERNSFTIEVKLGHYRPKITVALIPDKDSDEFPLGYEKPYSVNFTLPDPKAAGGGVASIEGAGEEPSPLKMYGPYGGEDRRGSLYAIFGFDRSLASHDQRDFIEVTPALPYILANDAGSLRFQEKLEPGLLISVTLKPGLTDASGRVLKEAQTRTFTVQDYQPAVRFAEPGHFLSPVFGGRVGLDLVNVNQVTFSLQRQYDNNLPFMSLEPDYRVQDMMRNIAFKEVILGEVRKNEVQRRAIDLENLAPGRRGVFMLTVRGYQEYKDERGRTMYAYAGSEERLVVLTDIGVTARTFPSGITVFASGLSSAKSLPNAEVKVYSRSNQLIAEGRTGADGVFTHKRGEEWDSQLTPSVVTVRVASGGEDDITFLALEGSAGVELEDPARRSYLESGYEAFVYTPRGVFRPGESVDVKAFVRDKRHQAPSPFPVLFRIFSPRGLELSKGSATLSKEGGVQHSFALPPSAPTGEYRVSVEIPGQKNRAIGNAFFSVEDFVPPRLEVAVTPGAERFIGGQELPVGLSGQYLFGAPGADLNFELGYRVSPKAFTPEGWDGYLFGDGERKFSTQSHLNFISGQLDSKGLSEPLFKAPADWLPPALLHVLLVGSVQEDGGRWTSQTGTATWFPTPYLLGLKLDGEHLVPGQAGTIRIAAVDPDGKAVQSGRLKAEISLVRSNWHTIYKDGRYVYTWNERFIPESSQSLESSDGRALLQFTPRQRGVYLVRVATEDGTVVASRRLNAWSGESWDDEGTGRMDAVELVFDKKNYRPGETARLSLKAPFAGTLLLGLEHGEQLSTRVLSLDQPSAELDIPVTADMDPNISVTAWVIRPVRAENREWYAHRAYGMTGLLLDKEPHTLNVAASTPERAAPSAPLSVPFTVTDEQGTPVEGEFSVALVDEGILSLTAFRTPDPVAYFMERRRAVGRSYDAFDALLRPEAKATPLLKPGGDASAADYQGSLSTQQVFLAAFLPTVKTDANGQGLAAFDIPEYSGKGRLMIVGASENRFASADANIRFARDIVVETAAPRAVAPGDAFDLSVRLFALPAEKPLQGEALLRVSAAGPLTIQGETEKTIPLDRAGQAGHDQGKPITHSLELAATALREQGIATITIQVTVPGRDDLSFSKTLEVAVRPPYPRGSVTTAALIRAGQEQTLTLPGVWLPGNLRTVFSVDKSPALAVLPMLEYLREYPYGCLEQVTSQAWPYLTLGAVREAMLPDPADSAAAAKAEAEAKSVLADAVSRILAMQTPDGGFTAWPGYSASTPWRSVNAAFFLVEAKARTPVPEAALENVLGYLRLVLAAPAEALGGDKAAYTTKAYAAFVLTRAGQAPLGWIQHLSEQQDKLLPSGRIFLAGAKALKAGNSSALKELREESLGLSGLKAQDNLSLESDLRNRSLLLYLWSHIAPADPKTTELCIDLASRIIKARWYSVQEAGMASMALGAYLEKTGGGQGDYTAQVTLEGGATQTVKNGERLIVSNAETLLNSDGTAPGLRVQVEGKGQAWCVYNLRGAPLEPPAPASTGLAIQRVWKRPDGTVIDLSSGKAALKKGDRVIVELTIIPQSPVHDLALSDLLPGGMEIENARLKGNAASANNDGAEPDNDREGGASGPDGMFIDIREDRLLVFFDQVRTKTTYSYSLRAVSRGTYVLPPLAADAMYDPAFSAVTATGVLNVE